MDMTIVSKSNAIIWMEGQEVCREYFKTEKITFGMSELPASGVGAIDHGHSAAHEVSSAYRARSRSTVHRDDTYYST